MRIGILTGGGDCPGLNAVIRAVTKRLLRLPERDVEVVGIFQGFLGLIQRNYRRLRDEDVSGLLIRGGTILGSSNRDDPFDFHGTIDGEEVHGDMTERVLANIRSMGLDGLIVVGGDGTMAVASRFAARGVPIVGVPKTIDNDLEGTDVTFGFHSAVQTATEAIDRLQTTADSHHRVMVVEVMGRYAGWIAVEAGIAGGADVILLPEIPFSPDIVANHVRSRRAAGKRSSIIVVAEGAAPAGGEMVFSREVATGKEKRRLGGVSHQVAAHIEEQTGHETRVAILGHIQRGGTPTPFDRSLGTRFGVAAADRVVSGDTGVMVALRNGELVSVPLEQIAGRCRKVPTDGPRVRTARGVGTCLGDTPGLGFGA